VGIEEWNASSGVEGLGGKAGDSEAAEYYCGPDEATIEGRFDAAAADEVGARSDPSRASAEWV
jgi:hypothetical protein